MLTFNQCDEKKPICSSCSRHSVPCEYINLSSPNPMPASKHSISGFPLVPLHNPEGSHSELLQSTTEFELNNGSIAESKSRRKLELRLLHHFISRTSQTFSSSHDKPVQLAWANDAPELALEHENLMHAIFAISTSHLLRSDPTDHELLIAQQVYKSLSLQQQREAVACLSSKNAEAVCLASSIILTDSFASLQNRSLSPYIPPVEWLYIARGGASIYSMALHTLKDFETATIRTFVKAEPQLNDLEALFADRNREGLLDLLSQDFATEVWNTGTRATYEKALSYIGGIQVEVGRGENQLATLRRMMAFPLLVPKEFLSFVEEQRPRALVILAHFFALAANMMDDVWWVGNTPQREIEGIRNVLPIQWQAMLQRPLRAVGLT